MVAIELKKLKKGSYFTLSPIENPLPNQVYIRGDYCRQSRRYECCHWNDLFRTRFLSGNRIVYIDFEF